MRSNRTHARRRTVTAAAVLLGTAVLAAGTSPALAKKAPDQNFLPFKYCPIGLKHLADCIYAETTSGEFKLGSKTVKIESPVKLSGGIYEGVQELIPPTNGVILEAAPMKVPGGLTGIEGVEGEEITATTELVGPVLLSPFNQIEEKGPAVVLPLRVKLSAKSLGEECFVGSAAEPVTLRLSTGESEPPSGTAPIKGSKGTGEEIDEYKIVKFSNTSLVDNGFAAPGAQGCGPGGLLDEVVDLASGLPSAAGKNVAILNGTVEETTPKNVKKSKIQKVPKTKG